MGLTSIANAWPGLRVPEDLLEVRNVLATRAEQWKQGWLLEGEQKGRQEG